ncbi:MAG: hypothetical protein Q4D38_15025 [Planctomycetia bacterium]|nr:hypothetical protein [Planctomycetia bacterium]
MKLNELRHAHKKAKEKWLADRIKAVFLVGSGRSVGDVAESDDVDALKQRLYRGRVARLTSVQKEGFDLAGRKSVPESGRNFAIFEKNVQCFPLSLAHM